MKIIDKFIDDMNNSNDKESFIKKNFSYLKKELISNEEAFFKESDRRYLSTIETIKKVLLNNYDIEPSELKKRLNYINARSRSHMKQVKKIESYEISKEKKYRYIMSPNAESHCSVCSKHSNKIYNGIEASAIKENLPFHIGCTCYFEEV